MTIEILCGDALECLRVLPSESVQTCVTSPPYWGLRDYGVPGQIGLEESPEVYTARLVEVFAEVRRVLRTDGTLWLNLGDSYARDEGKGEKFRNGKGHRWSGQNPNGMCGPGLGGLKPKDLVGIPWRVAFALQADGWYLRSDIIWHKPNPMPESVTDRPTKAHEYVFLIAKSERYFYNADAIKERAISGDPRKPYAPGQVDARGDGHDRNGGQIRPVVARGAGAEDWRNKRSVWTVPTQSYPEAHFATFPEDLIRPCILAGSPAGGTVLDPFAGSGTTLMVAKALGCSAVGIELNPQYVRLIEKRIAQDVFDFGGFTAAEQSA